MSSKQFLSIQGCFMYDNTLFDRMKLPIGVNKDIIVQQITQECSDLELIYPDVNVMKNLIEQWSIVELPIWEKYYNAQLKDYDPLNSINIRETRQEKRDLQSGSKSKSNTTGQDTQRVSAYNNEELIVREIDDSKSETNSDGTTTNTGTVDYDYHRFGYDNKWNMTESERLKKYIEVETSINIYHFITDSFMKRFCLMVY